MKETLERAVPGPFQTVADLRRSRPIFSPAAIFILIAFIALTGCGPKIARVAVSDGALIESNRLFQEGNTAYTNRDYYAALIKYLTAGEFNPNSEYISNRIGMAYLQLNYYDNAIAILQRSIALNSKYPFSINNLGSAYFAGGNLKKAEKYFKKAIKLKEDEASFHLNIGTVYFERKKPEKAIKAWRKSLALDPEILSRDDSIPVAIDSGGLPEKDRNYFIALVYASTGNIPKAIESLENALMQGFSDIERIENSPEFDPIREDARFVKFMESASVWAKANEPSVIKE
ncbi:MAG: tetratricopeptide repeat protein [Acidobacteria bacterium]|nr:tetratricopeptide repeat protein [Acidobacteriota bacterium]